MTEIAKPMAKAESMFPTASRRWAILIRHDTSGALRQHDFHHSHFPSEEDRAREALSQVDPQGLPVLQGRESLRALLAARVFGGLGPGKDTRSAAANGPFVPTDGGSPKRTAAGLKVLRPF